MATNYPNVQTLINDAKQKYIEEFDEEPNVIAYAPGRVNLIGEHTDYNEGFVLPMALPLITVVVGSKMVGDFSTIITTNYDVPGPHKVTINMPSKAALARLSRGKPRWADYVKGVIVNYFGQPPSFQAVVVTSVPTGGGLSSSASLEVAIYTFLDALTGTNDVLPSNKALACQKAEHDYAGVPCGIMDQFISVLGKEGNALLLDCRSLSSKLIPFNEPNIKILITNSNVKHELEGTEYSTRRNQCLEAALILKKLSLRDATIQDIDYLKSIDTQEEIIKRAKHVITEIDRTIKAAEALKERNFNKFGELMVESHRSLRDDFEVSCTELDNLVELALQVEGVLGSRMTGGGFGGCTVTMVYSYAIERLIKHIKKNYKGNATFYICSASNGATIVQN